MTTDVLDLDELAGGQVDPHLTVNEALTQLEGRTVRVLSRTTDAEPTPSEGDTYIITGSATGTDWSTYSEHDIAHYYGATWYNWTPSEGVRVWVNDEDALLAFDGSSWVDAVTYALQQIEHITKTADYTVTASDLGSLIVVDSSSAAVDITLPAEANATDQIIGVYLGTAGNDCVIQDDESPANTLITLTATDEVAWLVCDGTSWRVFSKIVAGAGSGDFSGPASSTDNAVVRFDGTGGKTGQDSGITVSDSDEVDGARMRDYTEVVASVSSSSNTTTLNLNNARVFTTTLTENTTIAFSNVPADNATSITIVFTQDGTGGRTVSWPASVEWAGGSAPTITSSANAVDVVTLMTPDQGTTWYGFTAGQDFS